MDTTKDSFILEAGPDTDIWRKPPTKDVWNGMYNPSHAGLGEVNVNS